MKLLLDTQAILWFLLDDHRLSGRARENISGPDALIFVSPASLWEIAIKISLGKYALPAPFAAFWGGTLTGTVSACPPFSIISGGNYSLGAGESQQVIVRYPASLEEGAQTCSFVFSGGGGITIQVKGTNKKVGLPWLLLLLGN